MTTTEPDDRAIRTKALIGLAVALVIGVVGWIWISSVTQRGLERLATIDRLRVNCEVAWRAATTRSETLRVDATPLPDTIDPRSAAAMTRCGNLRQGTRATPNPREMNGAPMPRGLR